MHSPRPLRSANRFEDGLASFVGIDKVQAVLVLLVISAVGLFAVVVLTTSRLAKVMEAMKIRTPMADD